MASLPPALLALVRTCLLPADLDDPSVEYLTSLIHDETEFLRSAPGSLSRAQLLHLLNELLEPTLVSYEVAADDSEARIWCGKLIDHMTDDKYIELAAALEEDAAASASASAYKAPLLSAPVRISDITRADAERESELEFSMAQIQKEVARSKWTPAEEKVIFQSLADTPQYADDEEDGDEQLEEGACAMCRRVMPLTRHHLIPRMHHKHGKFALMPREYLDNHVALICRPCHSAVHRMEDEKTLAYHFHTLELIMADERMKRWCAYASKLKVVQRPPASMIGKSRHKMKK